MASYPWGPPSPSASFTPPAAKTGIDALAERYSGMKEEITAIRATSSSSDGSVTVTAGPSGAVLDIQINERAMQGGSAKALSGSIMSALRLAVADGARQQAAIVQRYVGDRINIVDRVMATQKELLGDKIAAGEEEEERLRAERDAEAEHFMEPEPFTPRQTWSPSQGQPAQHAQSQHQQPRPRQPDYDEDEGFQGINGGDQW